MAKRMRRKKFKTCRKCEFKPATELPMTGQQLCRWCVNMPGWHLKPNGVAWIMRQMEACAVRMEEAETCPKCRATLRKPVPKEYVLVHGGPDWTTRLIGIHKGGRLLGHQCPDCKALFPS